ncbi:putative location of vulva defective 1-like [Penaeus vannamei]|uniref:Putative location of vulva defective 1-like n=1 Tax=Penaeus vannamei TaxID=6689 RepID=A0A3R7MS14_PENVA|nr:putative location of vulva defective 1-like [Penaeus vannamei]
MAGEMMQDGCLFLPYDLLEVDDASRQIALRSKPFVRIPTLSRFQSRVVRISNRVKVPKPCCQGSPTVVKFQSRVVSFPTVVKVPSLVRIFQPFVKVPKPCVRISNRCQGSKAVLSGFSNRCQGSKAVLSGSPTVVKVLSRVVKRPGFNRLSRFQSRVVRISNRCQVLCQSTLSGVVVRISNRCQGSKPLLSGSPTVVKVPKPCCQDLQPISNVVKVLKAVLSGSPTVVKVPKRRVVRISNRCQGSKAVLSGSPTVCQGSKAVLSGSPTVVKVLKPCCQDLQPLSRFQSRVVRISNRCQGSKAVLSGSPTVVKVQSRVVRSCHPKPCVRISNRCQGSKAVLSGSPNRCSRFQSRVVRISNRLSRFQKPCCQDLQPLSRFKVVKVRVVRISNRFKQSRVVRFSNRCQGSKAVLSGSPTLSSCQESQSRVVQDLQPFKVQKPFQKRVVRISNRCQGSKAVFVRFSTVVKVLKPCCQDLQPLSRFQSRVVRFSNRCQGSKAVLSGSPTVVKVLKPCCQDLQRCQVPKPCCQDSPNVSRFQSVLFSNRCQSSKAVLSDLQPFVKSKAVVRISNLVKFKSPCSSDLQPLSRFQSRVVRIS